MISDDKKHWRDPYKNDLGLKGLPHINHILKVGIPPLGSSQ